MHAKISAWLKASAFAFFVCAALSGVSAPFAAAEIARVTPEELKALIDDKADIVIVDVQAEAVFSLGHIPGAISLPWELELSSPGNLPADKDLVLYCACLRDEDSSDMARQLITLFEYDEDRVKLLEGGWLKWKEKGFPEELSK